MLLHLIGMAPTDGDPVEAFNVVRGELEAYGEKLGRRSFIVAFTKVDLLDEKARKDAAGKFFEETGLKVRLVSAATGEGMKPLLGDLAGYVERARGKSG